MKSMTGYGKGRAEAGGRTLTAEIKTVNNRFLDVNFKLPRAFTAFEDALRKQIAGRLGRGRADVFLTYEDNRVTEKSVNVDLGLAAAYVGAAKKLQDAFPQVADDFTLTALLKMPDVVRPDAGEEDEDALRALLFEAVDGALKKLEQMRLSEGAAMKADLEMRLGNITGLVEKIKGRAPAVAAELRAKIEARVRELLSGVAVDEAKLLNEAAFYADRQNIDEEIARLCSHVSQMGGMLKEKDGQGRKLDFIVQELNREANTVCSKSNDSELTAFGLALKAEIEKIREQVQNIE